MGKSRKHRMRIVTDTATLAVFDPARLRHRLNDPSDWWTWLPDLLGDLNAGNVLPVDLASDGVYSVVVHLDDDRSPGSNEGAVSGLIGCESGALYIGSGESITGDGLEPDASDEGLLLQCRAGSYRVWVEEGGDNEVGIWLELVAGEPRNTFTDYPRLRG